MRKILLFLIIIASLFVFIFILRFLIGGNEDSWICEGDQWVRHGQPSKPMPIDGCGTLEKNEIESSKNEKRLIGGDRDEHGCIPSAGYSWCELKAKCLRVWEEACE